MSTTEQYVRENLAKDVARALESLEQLKSDLERVNSDEIPEAHLTTIAEGIHNLSTNLGRSRLVTIIAAAISGGRSE